MNRERNIVPGVEKKVIKNGNLTLKVNSVDWSVDEMGKIAKDNGGDIFSSNFFKNTQNEIFCILFLIKILCRFRI